MQATRIGRRTRALAVALVALALFAVGGHRDASAHPLGNFTINTYSGVIVRTHETVVDYVVDMAEIPAFQERQRVDRDGDGSIGSDESSAYADTRCAAVASAIAVSVGGRPVALASDASAVSFPPGQGRLTTLRLECRLRGPSTIAAGSTSVEVDDRGFAARIGWHEITVAGDGVTIARSDVPAVSVSARLTRYPPNAVPIDIRHAFATVEPGGPRLATLPVPGGQSGDANSSIPGRDSGLLASLVGSRELSVWLVLGMLGLAVGAGSLHALGPGHGKTLIGASLLASGGSVRQAVGVGAAVSVMHTASVLVLGVLVLSAERVLSPERVYPWLGLLSGLVALALGAILLVGRLHAMSVARGRVAQEADNEHGIIGGHEHQRDHAHDAHAGDTVGHTHREHRHRQVDPAAPLGRRGLIALAFSGGILPSPSALVVLLAAVSLGRTALGVAMIGAFSIGLAASLIGVGVLALQARAIAARRFPTSVMRVGPVVSAAAMCAVGLTLAVRGAIQL